MKTYRFTTERENWGTRNACIDHYENVDDLMYGPCKNKWVSYPAYSGVNPLDYEVWLAQYDMPIEKVMDAWAAGCSTKVINYKEHLDDNGYTEAKG